MTRLTGAAKASHAARDFQALYGAALRAAGGNVTVEVAGALTEYGRKFTVRI